MIQFRAMREDEAEPVRDLWLQMCADVGTPLSETSAKLILVNLRHYAAHPMTRCFVAEEQQVVIGFLTCVLNTHPIIPGLSGEIEELYVQAHEREQEIQAQLVKQAVNFLQEKGAASIHVNICVGDPECVEATTFWQSLGWENDMTIFSIYSNVPGSQRLQRIWDEYRIPPQDVIDDVNG